MQQKIITGKTDDEIWKKVAADLKDNPDLLQYNAVLDQQGSQVAFIIDIDPGGGFESGYAITQFIAPLNNAAFQLSIHKQGFFQEAGKLFGLQDINVGNPDIDKKFMIRSDKEAIVKRIFAMDAVCSLLLSLGDIRLHTSLKENNDGNNKSYLEISIEDGITNTVTLRKMYTVLFLIRDAIDEELMAR